MAIVYDKIYNNTSYDMSDVEPIIDDLTPLWNWSGIDTGDSITYAEYSKILWVDSSKTYGIGVSTTTGSISGERGLRICIIKNGAPYHQNFNDYYSLNVKIEKTSSALILSVKAQDNLNSVSATDCDKYIICNATNTVTNTVEPIVIYLSSKASSNVCAMIASDVVSLVDITAQNANENTSAKTTNLIPFYNPSSAFITTDIFVSLCENINTWGFSNVIINKYTFRMSGSVFARDI